MCVDCALFVTSMMTIPSFGCEASARKALWTGNTRWREALMMAHPGFTSREKAPLSLHG